MSSVLVSPAVLRGPQRPELIRHEVLADLFEASAARWPDHPALIDGDRTITYGELNALADRAASRLIDAGVRPGQVIGLWLPRGADLLTMQLAITKSGAAWLPFDADTPAQRIALCLNDARAIGLIIGDQSDSPLQATEPPLLRGSHLDKDEEADGAPQVWRAGALLAPTLSDSLRRRMDPQPDQPAYLIYTSGSTGTPKGIVISQRSICHFLRSENTVLDVRHDDRVYQGFSVAFDMSFEEIWIAYLCGATLIVAPREVVADPDLLSRFLVDQRVSVLHAVPTLLGLFRHNVPGLRLINLGGEACPETLVARWCRPGRRVFNSYGPSEATVSASLVELRPGEAVSIGTPLPNYGLLVIATEEDDTTQPPPHALRLLPPGATGELCIVGPGLAQGYLGRPGLTAEKFPSNPWATGPDEERLYRTGDLARFDDDGRAHWLGRADDQVKIRGFRVELGEIEVALSQQPGVGAAAVLLTRHQDVDTLIAYVAARPETRLDTTRLRRALADRLPAYMVPGRILLVPVLPRLLSGKIDRKTLMALPMPGAEDGPGEPDGTSTSDPPRTPLEAAMFAALSKLFPGQVIRRDADFFDDLGGHSLLVARFVSALRNDPQFAHVAIRDVYQHRTVEAIAAALQTAQADRPPRHAPDWTPAATWHRWRCGLAQAAAVPVLVALRMVQWLAPFFTYHFFTGSPGDSIPFAVVMSVLMYLLATVFEFAVAIAGKWLIAGRLKPGRYPLWGLTYFRWWLTDRLIEAAPVYLISGSSLHAGWWRLLGARIGHDVVIGSIKLRVPDLFSADDEASIGNAVNFENARVERGQLLLGRIELGAASHVGSYAVLEGGTRIGRSGHLDAQSALAEGQSIPDRRIWSGSPSRDIGAFDPSSLPARPPVSPRRRAVEAAFFVTGAMLVATLFFLPVFPTFMLIDQLDDTDRFPWLETNSILPQLLKYFVLALPASGMMILLVALLSAAIRWTVLPRPLLGSWPVHSAVYCRKWLVNLIQEISLQVLHGVYATVYAASWYRLLGAKVGPNAEISTALGVVPNTLTLGEESFIADAVLLGDEEIDGGWLTMQPTHIGRRSFIGNGSYIPDGTTLPDNVLIGVLSRAPDPHLVKAGQTWVGTPPVFLPARETVAGHAESLTFKPSPIRRVGRGLVEAFRIMAPHAVVIAAGYSIVLAVMPYASASDWGMVAWHLMIDGLVFGLSTFLFVALFKWLLIGRYTPCAVPMWTPFVWLCEAATNLYEGITVPNFMHYLRGTPFAPIAFNLLGCHIGRGVYLDTTDITEFDCVTIGDHSEINAQCCPQTHLFEDRVMKIDHVRIGSKVTIGPRTTVLYGATVNDLAQLGALTLVMKGETIPAGSVWRGSPATPD